MCGRIAAGCSACALVEDVTTGCGRGLLPVRPSNIRLREWKQGVAAARLVNPQPTPHSLRHTAVSLWIDRGASPFDVARFAAHRDISTVHRIYGHLFELDVPEQRAGIRGPDAGGP